MGLEGPRPFLTCEDLAPKNCAVICISQGHAYFTHIYSLKRCNVQVDKKVDSMNENDVIRQQI